MTGFTIKRARRAHARLRLGVSSVSGGGKTMGSLRVAKGIIQFLLDTGQIEGGFDGKIALIDSERKSAQLYASVVPFDTIELEPPYSVDRYQQALEAIERAGYAVCIFDQISHAWAGPGGQLEWIDALKAKATNHISPWSKITPVQQEFYDRMLRSPMHIIATMRAKSEWVIDDVVVDGRTKKVPRKIGLSPVQREGIEYEFTAMLDIELESHMATSSKDRTQLFDGRSTLLDEACGRRLAEWLMSGEAIQLMEAPKADSAATPDNGKAEADAKRKKLIGELEDGVEDLKLSFIECSTLPDLAGQFDKGQKFVRKFLPDLGAEVLQPHMAGLVAEKDLRKAAIENSQQTKSILIDEKGVVVGEVAAVLQPGETVKIGAIEYEVGALASKSEFASVFYSKPKEAPAGGDLLGGGLPNRMAIEDVKKLASFAVNEGLSDAETLEALGVKDIAELPQNGYAEASEKIMQAARAKLNSGKPARAKREKAAA